MSSITLNPNASSIPIRQKISIPLLKQNLKAQIETLGQTDPKKASLLSHKIVCCNWTSYEISHLKQLGLKINGLLPAYGLPGGGLTDLVVEAIIGTIQILYEGNENKIRQTMQDEIIKASIKLPDGNLEEGVHKGGRIHEKFKKRPRPKYRLLASGPGEFTSQKVTYRGNFFKNVFHDNTGQAQYFIEHRLRYIGGFENGKRSGFGQLENYNEEKRDFYLYYKGTWKEDKPHTGTLYDQNGGTLELKEGMIVTIQQSPQPSTSAAASTSHHAPPSQKQRSRTPSPTRSAHEVRTPGRQTPILQTPSIPPHKNPLVQSKLDHPDKRLTLEESTRLLLECIAYGNQEATKAQNKELVIFLGNTGAGKSTTVNYLYGCTMQLKKPRELGFKGIRSLVVVKPQQDGGTLDEIMPIGHTKQSKTFMPQIETDPHIKNTYCDCPGFLDNRGAEINIANAVNIKNALKAAKSVKVIMLINYHSLLADRGRGLSEMLKISSDLFGNTSNLIHHKDAILVGITSAPLDLDREDLIEWVADSNITAMQQLSERLFTFDPLDRPLPGAWDRKALLKEIQNLTPISEPSRIFRTVLTYEDESKLLDISQQIGKRIQNALSQKNFQKAAHELNCLKQLRVIDHAAIERLIAHNNTQIQTKFQTFISTFKDHCNFERFKLAEELFQELEKALSHFEENITDLKALEDYYSASQDKYQKELQKEKDYQDQIRKANQQIEQFIALLDQQKKHTEEQLAFQKQNFQAMIQEMEENMKATLASYETKEKEAKQEMEERLTKKEANLRELEGKNEHETERLLKREREKLEREYQKKLEQMEREKEALKEEQRTQKAEREQILQAEQEKLKARLAEIEAKKVEQKQLQKNYVPEMAFGKAKWRQYFGDVGVEPPLPPNIDEILNSPCPFWPEKKVYDTHLLVLIPHTVNDVPFTLDYLQEIYQRPKHGHKGKIGHYNSSIKSKYGNIPTSSHWVLMTRDMIPNSRRDSFDNQKKLLSSYAQKSHQPYVLPTALEGATCMLMEYVETGKKLSWTFMRSQEQIAIGGFSPGQLNIDIDCAIDSGIAGALRIPTLAFGKTQWEYYFGPVGNVPSLPSNIDQILDSPCPFWPGKKVRDTHMLTLIPQTVNQKPFNLNALQDLVQHPQNGHATKYGHYNKQVKDTLGNKSEPSHWILMTREELPAAKQKTYVFQQKMLAKFSLGNTLQYEFPTALEATTCILMEFVQTGIRSYITDRGRTRCVDMINSSMPVVIGNFTPDGIHVSYDQWNANFYGTAGVLRLKP